MNFEKKPVLLLVLATLSILVGTIITMIMPFAWVNTPEDRIAEVKPYSPLQLEGRDVYIREGCNNCHSQTVRPLEADVKRYGPYSRSGEFYYDRPHLWGSRRMGPDLARIGTKYPDAWHYKHMASPASMVPETNMPSYAFLSNNKLDPELAVKKMKVLGFPFTDKDIGGLVGKTEMDAMVAYLQKLGSDLARPTAPAAPSMRRAQNPFAGNKKAAEEGEEYYEKHCKSCHGKKMEGDIGPDLVPGRYSDGQLFDIIRDGRKTTGMPSFGNLGEEKIWQIVTRLNKRD